MKLNRKSLRKMILKEIRLLKETRQEHLTGIIAKINRLETEVERLELALEEFDEVPYIYSDDPYYTQDLKDDPRYHNLQMALNNAQNSLDILEQQKAQMEADTFPGGVAKAGPVGQLYRGF